MQPRRNRREMTPHLYGTHGCNCVGEDRKNDGENTSPFVMLGVIAVIGVVGWVVTKPARDAKIEKDRAIAEAIREGKVDSLNVGSTEATVTGYGMSF